MAGPITRPASKAPTTCGRAIRLVMIPSTLVLSQDQRQLKQEMVTHNEHSFRGYGKSAL